MKVDYSQGKIYKITNNYNNDVYIGSTCDSLCKRFSYHKTHSKIEKNKNRPIYKLMNEIGHDRFRIQLIIDFPCEDKYQLRQKEGEYIRNEGTLNMVIAGRTMHEYQQDNKDYVNSLNRKFYHNNLDKMKERKHIYYEKNKERILEDVKQFREQNKEKINEKGKEKLLCVCGCLITRNNMSEHKKTKKHIDLLDKKNNEEPQNKKLCNVCNVELTEEYKNCDCRRCEDWGGCKTIEGYFFLKCLGCDKDFETTRTIKWESDYKRGIY